MQITRLVETIYILMRKKTVTAGMLAEHFGVSTRTIYRDVDVLSLSGIPVFTEKGKGGGISLMPGFVLDKSLLNEHDQNEILSALQGLAGIHAAETDKVLTKLSALFNKNMVNWLDVDFSGWNYGSDEVFDNLKTAVLQKRIVIFGYYSSLGERTERRVEPLQMWFKHRSWYVKAFCLTKMDVRLFKLTRIQNLELTDEIFSERKLLSAASTEEADNSLVDIDVSIVLKIAPCMAYRVFDEFSGYEIERNEDGSFTVTVTWPEDEWVYGMILSYGEHIEVLEPKRLRKIIKDKASKIVRQYTNMT